MTFFLKNPKKGGLKSIFFPGTLKKGGLKSIFFPSALKKGGLYRGAYPSPSHNEYPPRGPSICTHGHEAIQGLPGSNNARQAPKIILVIMCMRCLFVELNIVADSRVYGNLNLGHRGRVMHTGVGEIGHR